jgi:hypothetical protein
VSEVNVTIPVGVGQIPDAATTVAPNAARLPVTGAGHGRSTAGMLLSIAGVLCLLAGVSLVERGRGSRL